MSILLKIISGILYACAGAAVGLAYAWFCWQLGSSF
jgi:hypothetical protein